MYVKVLYTGDLSVEIIKDTISLASNSSVLGNLELEPKSYMLFTMHRAENTNYEKNMSSVIHTMETLSQKGIETKIIFPVRLRTSRKLKTMVKLPCRPNKFRMKESMAMGGTPLRTQDFI